MLVSGYIPPVDVRVRLFMDMGHNPGFTGMAQMRAKLRRWLMWPGGAAWSSGNTGYTYMRIDRSGQAGYLTAI